MMLLTSCPESTTPITDELKPNFQEGISVNYQIPATKNYLLYDSISNLTFSFPDGIESKLKITKINQGHEIDINERAFKFEYEVNGSCLAIISSSEPTYCNLWVFREYITKIFDFYQEIYNSGWFPLPESKIEGNNVYSDITKIPTPSIKEKSDLPQGVSIKRTFIFKSSNYPKSSPKGRTVEDFEKLFKDVSNNFLNNLSPNLKASISSKLNGSHKYSVSLLWGIQDKLGTVARYVDFYDHTLLIPRCAFVLSGKFTTPRIAIHEAGHYFHHLLVVDQKFYDFTIKTKGFGFWHVISKPRGRTDLIEDFAYIFEYLFNNDVSSKKIENGDFLISYENEKTKVTYKNAPLVVVFYLLRE